MSDDFPATANRMMVDADTLHRSGAHRNACYLAGYVVECTLKTLLNQAGEAVRKRHDLLSLHDAVNLLLVNGNVIVARYGDPTLLAPTMCQQIKPPLTQKGGEMRYFCHWDPEHRYDGTRWHPSSISTDYLREAQQCHNILTEMFVDGLVVL
jgi:hypothetical protein